MVPRLFLYAARRHDLTYARMDRLQCGSGLPSQFQMGDPHTTGTFWMCKLELEDGVIRIGWP
jgi:hypothetical protein